MTLKSDTPRPHRTWPIVVQNKGVHRERGWDSTSTTAPESSGPPHLTKVLHVQYAGLNSSSGRVSAVTGVGCAPSCGAPSVLASSSSVAPLSVAPWPALARRRSFLLLHVVFLGIGLNSKTSLVFTCTFITNMARNWWGNSVALTVETKVVKHAGQFKISRKKKKKRDERWSAHHKDRPSLAPLNAQHTASLVGRGSRPLLWFLARAAASVAVFSCNLARKSKKREGATRDVRGSPFLYRGRKTKRW